jgi:hypothetical protein
MPCVCALSLVHRRPYSSCPNETENGYVFGGPGFLEHQGLTSLTVNAIGCVSRAQDLLVLAG